MEMLLLLTMKINKIKIEELSYQINKIILIEILNNFNLLVIFKINKIKLLQEQLLPLLLLSLPHLKTTLLLI